MYSWLGRVSAWVCQPLDLEKTVQTACCCWLLRQTQPQQGRQPWHFCTAVDTFYPFQHPSLACCCWLQREKPARPSEDLLHYHLTGAQLMEAD